MVRSRAPKIVTDPEWGVVAHMIGTLNRPPPGAHDLTAPVRELLVQLLRAPAQRLSVGRRVAALLPQALRLHQGRGDAVFTFTFDRRAFRVSAVPVLDRLEQVLVYGLALLLDTSRGYARGLCQCTAPIPRQTKDEGETEHASLRDVLLAAVAARSLLLSSVSAERDAGAQRPADDAVAAHVAARAPRPWSAA